MSERNYYVICDDNCRFEGMTKEEILAAIIQAVEQGEIHDVDTGFITKIKEQNAQRELTFWVGTQAQYNAISEPVENMMYLITDPQADAEMQEQINQLREDVDAIPTSGALLWQGEAKKDDVITVNNADKYNVYIVTYGTHGGTVNHSGIAVRNIGTAYIEGHLGFLEGTASTIIPVEEVQAHYSFTEGANNEWTVNNVYDFRRYGEQVGLNCRVKAIYGIA